MAKREREPSLDEVLELLMLEIATTKAEMSVLWALFFAHFIGRNDRIGELLQKVLPFFKDWLLGRGRKALTVEQAGQVEDICQEFVVSLKIKWMK